MTSVAMNRLKLRNLNEGVFRNNIRQEFIGESKCKQVNATLACVLPRIERADHCAATWPPICNAPEEALELCSRQPLEITSSSTGLLSRIPMQLHFTGSFDAFPK